MKTTFYNCPPEQRTALRIQARKALANFKKLLERENLIKKVVFIHPNIVDDKEGFFLLQFSIYEGLRFYHQPGAIRAYRIIFFNFINRVKFIEFQITKEPWAQNLFEDLLNNGLERLREEELSKMQTKIPKS